MPDGTKVNPKYLEKYQEMNPNAVEGKDYFLEGKTYDKPSSNNTSKPITSGTASSTTSTQKVDDKSTEFKGMLVESAIANEKLKNKTAIEKGTNSSLDRMEAMVNNANNTSSVIKNTYDPTGINNPVQNFQPKSAVSSESQIMRNPQDVKNEEMKARSNERLKTLENTKKEKEIADNRAEYKTKQDMNYEKYGGDRDMFGSTTNQYGISYKTARADAKRRFQGGSPIYSAVDDLTRSLTGSMVEASKKGTWDGYVPNVMGALGKPLSWMGVDKKGVGFGEIAKQIAWHAPGSGELMDAYHLGKDIYKGVKGKGFDDAKLSLAALATPFASANDMKHGFRATTQLLKGTGKTYTNITGKVNKFSKSSANISKNINKTNPFKILENSALGIADKSGLQSVTSTFRTAKGQYKRNILQQKSIEKSKNEPIAVKTNKNIKPIG